DVNSQPYGLKEIEQGATNRLNNLLKLITPDDQSAWFVSIENGVVLDADTRKMIDIAYVVVKHGENVYAEWSNPIELCPSLQFLEEESSYDQWLERYRSIIMPIIYRGEDLYSYYSDGQRTRQGEIEIALISILRKSIQC
ncbi:unnamed protein product, partial [Didymodactylos carnosus]